MESQYVVAVVGGAVAGSEAVYQLREKGICVICIDQNALPYGKIEDGLPRWHVEQRKKEEEKIDERLDHALVDFVPKTKVGGELSFAEILKDWKLSALLLANGAWRDRPLGVKGIDAYVGKGLLYQNPLVYWFNHYHEPHYNGPTYEIPDGTLVVGGGLASMDVVKICQLELVQKVLHDRGHRVDVLSLEKEGIPKILEHLHLSWTELGLKGTSLYYRRTAQDMPLATPPERATVDQEQKTAQLREKILKNFQSKYLFQFHPLHVPTSAIVENDHLVGLNFAKTEVTGKTVRSIPSSEMAVRSPLVVSSIGSLPEPIKGLPMKGETYAVNDLETGAVESLERVYALGNAVTGRGNIRVSLMHGRQVAQKVAQTLLANPALKMDEPSRIKVLQRVRELQKNAQYDGNYKNWITTQLALRKD